VAPPTVQIAVVGAHLTGEPLNAQLTDREATLVASTQTAPSYRLFALDTVPAKPGLVRVADGDERGAAIEVEVWQLDVAAFGDFVEHVPAPLCIGRVRLAGGDEVAGFLCEPVATDGAADITSFGGWRAYRRSGAG
jgi:allophanate hydrolase